MGNIKLTTEYDGKRYSSWQKLRNDDKAIQGKVKRVLHQVTDEEIEVIRSGRTDADTHIRGQVANFKVNTEIGLSEMIDLMNHHFPWDTVIKRIEEMSERSHTRYNAVGKKYSYYVWSNVILSAFEWNHSLYFPQELDVDKLNTVCRKLMGTYGLIGFSALKESRESTVRTTNELSIGRRGEMLYFTFIRDELLYKTVRIIMGTLLEVGVDAIPIETIDGIFGGKMQQHAEEAVPAQGLFLGEVYYRS